MKTFAVAFIFSLAFHAQLFAQTTSWDYPVKPGSAEWAAFSSRDEMRFACEIPSDILSSVSTETLVELCLNYPRRKKNSIANMSSEEARGVVSICMKNLVTKDKQKTVFGTSGLTATCMLLNAYLDSGDSGGLLRITCKVYSGSSLIYTAYCYVNIYGI